MGYVRGVDREQITLFPESIDDYLTEDNPVRFIDAFVESLDFRALAFKHSVTKATGRPPYDPALLLKLYIYGYLNRIRSSRRLEKEAARNVELIWLLGKLAPDFKTIADFRKDNLESVRGIFREFTAICKKLELFGSELVAIDGSKFRAQNSKKRSFSAAKLKRSLKHVDAKIDEYLTDLDEADKAEAAAGTRGTSVGELKEKIEALKNRKTKYGELSSQMEQSGKEEVALTDPEARSMMNAQRVEPCYNAQVTVDARHKLIVDYELIDSPADQGNLNMMATRAKEMLGAGNLEVLADKGYYDSKDIKACIEGGITPLVPKPSRRPPKADGAFAKDRFVYDKVQDCFICPADARLFLTHIAPERGKIMHRYRTDACPTCDLKPKCTKAAFRTIGRWEHEHLLEAMETRVRENKDKVRQRQWLSEHPFGTIKRGFDQGYFLLRGKRKVQAEFGLSALAYNIKRAINIVGTKTLVEMVRQSGPAGAV